MIAAHEDWKEEVGRGKMFGVLIVERTASNEDGERMEQTNLGFLAAYSGQIGGRSDWEGFVPAVFDYLQPNGYFKQHEAEIDQLNREVERLTASAERLRIIESLNMVRARAEKAIARHQAVMKAAKMLRDQRRREALLSEREQHEMIRESQFQKAELHRMKQRFSDEIEKKEQKKVVFDKRIQTLKHKRKEKSDDLQRWLFSHFEMLNKEGERRNLLRFSQRRLCVCRLLALGSVANRSCCNMHTHMVCAHCAWRCSGGEQVQRGRFAITVNSTLHVAASVSLS